MKINVNWQCKVTLKPSGLHILATAFPKGPLRLKGNVWEAPLWEVMQVFGKHIYMGPPPPFETTIEIIPTGYGVTQLSEHKHQMIDLFMEAILEDHKR